MHTLSPPPRVLLPACGRMLGDMAFHIAGSRYVEAVRLAGCLPLVVPAAREDEIDTLLDFADGVFLTGSPSNVHPRHFGEAVHDPSLPLDEARDAWTLKLIPRALERGIPLLAICRGFQEMNVALGGSLYQQVHAEAGMLDHREPADADLDAQFAERHEVLLAPGSAFAQWAGGECAVVNSLHGQGVKRLGEGMVAEARAPDGLVEGVRVAGAPGFAYGVQWHPEWRHEHIPFYRRTLEAFAAACLTHRREREEAEA